MGKKERVLLVHNFYQQPGGEDMVFAAEKQLLEENGHEVRTFTRHNDAIGEMGAVRSAAQLFWSAESYRAMTQALADFRPDVVHFHNTFGVLSPAVYHACHKAGVAVVQTIHNYRLLCANAYLYRDGQVCETCIGQKWPLAGIRHACYRESRLHSAAVAGMVAAHRALGTWERKIDRYIALTEFAKGKLVEGGLSAEKIAVKPNFLPNPPAMRKKGQVGEFALFVGRISPEKGIRELLHIWQFTDTIPLVIIGDGPLKIDLERSELSRNRPIRWIGRLPSHDVISLLQQARILLFPSQWYECYPMTLIEAFACGVPVIANDLGSVGEICHNQSNSLLVKTKGTQTDPVAWAETVRWAWDNPERLWELGVQARLTFEATNTPAQNYKMLQAIYQEAIAVSQGRSVGDK